MVKSQPARAVGIEILPFAVDYFVSYSHSPRGLWGLKYEFGARGTHLHRGHSPRGLWGLKYREERRAIGLPQGHSPRGLWGLKLTENGIELSDEQASQPARAVGIEIVIASRLGNVKKVTAREGCGD